MNFTKMHGAGNDYIFLDCFRRPPPEQPEELAKIISHRHYGVGGDGLILICPSSVADVRMRIFNADGSEAEMCGNGIRCLAKYVYDHKLVRRKELRVETGRGVLHVRLEAEGGKAKWAEVDMGEPMFEAEQIPALFPNVPPHEKIIALSAEDTLRLDRTDWAEDCGWDRHITCVSMGNPHLILFCRHLERVPLAEVGPKLEHHPAFPRRTNVHFVHVRSPQEAAMRTWERGSGITLACGTGACAAGVAAACTGLTGRKLLMHVPGGKLEVRWADNNHVFLAGEAMEVFSGRWPNVAPRT